MMKRIIWIWMMLLVNIISPFAQAPKKSYSLKDSVDQAFDASDYIINANGFIPVPLIITEPALGGFGGALLPIFIKKRPPYIDSIRGKQVITPIAPDVTGAMVMYTANNSWMVGGGRGGTIVKSRIKYRVYGAYGSINMSFFRDVAASGEKEFKFNFKIFPAGLQAIKRIGFGHWYAGAKYFFMNTKVSIKNEPMPDFVKDKELSSTVSQLGVVGEFDNRDNIFTPDNGLKFHVDVNRSDDIFGSDYDFWRLNYYTYIYKQLFPSLTGGLRIDGQQVFGDAPFYILPYIDMRGVEAARYQGNADLLSELEFRLDFVPRWSLILFGGTGTAFNEWSDFSNSKWIFSYGSGFRYLLARKFKLRVGIDIARGPDTWAYYIVFGSNWMK